MEAVTREFSFFAMPHPAVHWSSEISVVSNSLKKCRLRFDRDPSQAAPH